MALYVTAIGISPKGNNVVRESFCDHLKFPLKLKVGDPLTIFPELVLVEDETGEPWPCDWFIYEKKNGKDRSMG